MGKNRLKIGLVTPNIFCKNFPKKIGPLPSAHSSTGAMLRAVAKWYQGSVAKELQKYGVITYKNFDIARSNSAHFSVAVIARQ